MLNKKIAIYAVIVLGLVILSALLVGKYWTRETSPALPNRFSCIVDSDCKNTCRYGAVNKSWTETDSCVDGCASNAMGDPKCIENSCVAYDYKGEAVPYCTRLD